MNKIYIVCLVLVVSGCGAVMNKSSVDYKTKALVPAVDRTAQGPGRCYIASVTGEDGSDELVEVNLNGSPESVASSFAVMNGSVWQGPSSFLYACDLMESSRYSVGGNSYWNSQGNQTAEEALKEARAANKAIISFLKRRAARQRGASAPPIETPPPSEQPAPPAAAPSAPTAPVPSVAPAAPTSSACQDINNAQSFADLANVVEKIAAASSDQSEKDEGRQLAAYFRKEGAKPNPNPNQFQGLKNTMKASNGCQ